jgi:hypothetical protein
VSVPEYANPEIVMLPVVVLGPDPEVVADVVVAAGGVVDEVLVDFDELHAETIRAAAMATASGATATSRRERSMVVLYAPSTGSVHCS